MDKAKEEYKKEVENLKWLKMTLNMDPKHKLRLMEQLEAKLNKPCPVCGKPYIEK